MPAIKFRIRCSRCNVEVGMGDGFRPDFERLLKHLGWKIGDTAICPKCLKLPKKKEGRYEQAS